MKTPLSTSQYFAERLTSKAPIYECQPINKLVDLCLYAMWVLFFTLFSTQTYASGPAAAAANLSQARNGTDTIPINPVQWVNGNLGNSNAHYNEGMSSPYQCMMTGVKVGVQVTLTIGYDNKNSGKHAFDYLTHYNRMMPHNFMFHSTPEVIDPLAGTGLATGTSFTTYPIPAPSSAGSPVSGYPTASFNALPANERLMTMYNGTIDSIYYVVQGNLMGAQSETHVAIVFTPFNSTAVLVWGGHLASRNDWGYTSGVPNSAGGISGSPFHMRLVAWSINNLGSQDRSLSGYSVGPPPSGPLPVELINFSASMQSSLALLEWSTSSEINNDYFTLERASEDSEFKFFAMVNGSGNSTTLKQYILKDPNPLTGVNYYRLSQTDYDGHKQVFPPVFVRNNDSKTPLASVNVFPNPVSGDFTLTYISPDEGFTFLEITDTKGTQVGKEKLNSIQGINVYKFRTDQLPRGIYFLSLSDTEGRVLIREIIKQ